MENFGEKMGRKIFLVGIWLEEGEEKKLVGRRGFVSGLDMTFFFLDMIFIS